MAEHQKPATKTYFDPQLKKTCIKILPGEYTVSNEHTIVTTLGSCISACIRDIRNGVGGMNHFMLPASDEGSWGGVSASTRYGNFAMEYMINEILKRGGLKRNLQAKIFGGGEVMHNDKASSLAIGNNNISFAHQYLRTENIPIIAEDVGQKFARKIYFDPVTGQVVVKKIDMLRNNTIHKREDSYANTLAKDKVESDITLF